MTLDEYLKHRAGPGPRPYDAPQDEHDKALIRTFAAKIGVSYRTVYRYLTGERFPHPAVMRQIIKVTDKAVGHVTLVYHSQRKTLANGSCAAQADVLCWTIWLPKNNTVSWVSNLMSCVERIKNMIVCGKKPDVYAQR